MALRNFFSRLNPFVEKTVTPKDGQAWMEFFGLSGTKSGVQVTTKNVDSVAAFWNANRLIAETVASLPLNVYERTSTGKQIAFDHPVYDLLHNEPNPTMSSFDLRETMQSSVNIKGNGVAMIERGKDRRPVKLIYIDWEDVTDMRLIDGELFYRITGLSDYIHSSDLLHIKGIGSNGLVGKSVIRAHAENLGMTLAAQNMGAEFFGNGMHQQGVLESEQKLTKEVKQQILEGWKTTYQGGNSQYAIALLDNGFKFKRIAINPEEAQFLQTRKFQVLEVCRMFNISPAMLHDLEKGSFANMEQQSLNYVIYSARPWLKRWEQELDRKLFRTDERKRYFVKFNIEGLLRGDTKARTEYITKMIDRGVLTINEARSLENYNKVEGGDQNFFPLNYTTINKIGQNGNDE